jgi:hypothetical protein
MRHAKIGQGDSGGLLTPVEIECVREGRRLRAVALRLVRRSRRLVRQFRTPEDVRANYRAWLRRLAAADVLESGRS